VLGKALRRPRRAVAEQERYTRRLVVGRRKQNDDIAFRRERVTGRRGSRLGREPVEDLPKTTDLDPQPGAMRRVDSSRIERDRNQLVAGNRLRPRASESEQEREQDGPSPERNRGAPGDHEAPAGIDEQHLASRNLLDGEEVGAAGYARAQRTSERKRQLALDRQNCARNKRMRRPLKSQPRASEGVAGLGGRQRTDRDLRLRERRHRSHVRCDVPGKDLFDHAASFAESSEEHLGTREHEALHGGVVSVADRIELLGGDPRGSSRGRRIARTQRDLDEGRSSARARPSIVGERLRAKERLTRELQIAELRVRHAAHGEAERAVGAPHEAERTQRIALSERTPSVEQGGGNRRHWPSIDRPRRFVTRAMTRVRVTDVTHRLRSSGLGFLSSGPCFTYGPRKEIQMPNILHRVGIDAPVEKVYETLTTLEGNRAWWDSSAVGDAKKGGLLTFFKNWDFKVVETKPNELVKWKCVRGDSDWLDTEIIFQLVHKKGQTFVLFTHADWKEPVEFMHHCSTKWATFLLSLKQLLETGKGRPAPGEVQIEVGG
jgi:uncharacterized protein YndB with AHSA1/START domain